MESLALHPVFSSSTAALLIFGSAAAVSFFLIYKDSAFSPGRRRTLAALRGVFFFIFAFLLFRPSIVRQTVRHLPASAAVLLDTSESMSIADLDGRPRFAAAEKALREGRDADKNGFFSFFQFDRELVQLEEEGGLPAEPKGKETAIGEALAKIHQQFAGQRLLGILLVSDGAERSSSAITPQEAALALGGARLPVYTCCTGASGGGNLRDVAVGRLAAPARSYLGNEVSIEGVLQATGCVGETIRLTLSVEGEESAQQEVRIESNVQATAFRFPYTSAEAGQRQFTVSADPVSGETTPSNNSADVYIDFMRGNLRVLFLEGTRRFEDKFIRMALDSKQEIRVDYVRIPAGEKMDETAGYSAVILGDINPDDLDRPQVRALENILSGGAGLIILAGLESLAENNLGRERMLAQAAPITLPNEQLDADNAEQGFIGRPLHVGPVTGESGHFLARLARERESSKKEWEELPCLESVLDLERLQGKFSQRFGTLKPGSEIVLEGTDDTGKTYPVLIVGAAEKTRTAVLLTDATWRWAMSEKRNAFETFWRQLVLWTAGRDALAPGELDVELESSCLVCGETARFQTVYMPFNPTSKEEIVIDTLVDKPDGTRRTLTSPETFTETDVPGEYRLTVSVSENGKRTEQIRRFMVRENRRELESPTAAEGMMRNIAEMTRGAVIKPEQIADFYRQMIEKKETVTDRVRQYRSLFDSWIFFFSGVGLLSAEWFLRKRWGRA